MIVASRFAGDSDEATMWMQHDQYGEVLRMMVDAAIRAWQLAEAILGVETAEGARLQLPEFRYDHRTMQDAHDMLAGWWRFRAGLWDARLPGLLDEDRLRKEWLAFAATEIAALAGHCEFVRNTVFATVHGNTLAGHAAEKRLAAFLRGRYASMDSRRPEQSQTTN